MCLLTLSYIQETVSVVEDVIQLNHITSWKMCVYYFADLGNTGIIPTSNIMHVPLGSNLLTCIYTYLYAYIHKVNETKKMFIYLIKGLILHFC